MIYLYPFDVHWDTYNLMYHVISTYGATNLFLHTNIVNAGKTAHFLLNFTLN